jgi:dTDP-4-dehydrorhamnose 3,5-epimerase
VRRSRLVNPDRSTMKVSSTALPGVLIIEPRVFGDDRGYFFESHNQREFEASAGLGMTFVQDNQSRSKKNVLRGLHYQNPQAQGKLLRVLAGEVFDVVVDIRRSSFTFGKWSGVRLSSDNRLTIWMPPGFAHGFIVLSDYAEVLYKTTDYYAPQHEHCIRWDDPALGIEWPLAGAPEVSAKDEKGVLLKDARVFA